MNVLRGTRFEAGINAALLAVAGVFTLLQFGLFPLLFHPALPAAIAFVLLSGLLAPLHWGLMHETIHSSLARDEAWNRRIGRLLGIPLGLSWEIMRFGHLAHHAFNRHSFDRPEQIPANGSFARSAPLYYFKLVGGHSIIPAALAFTFLLPVSFTNWMVDRHAGDEESVQFATAVGRTFGDPARRRRGRTDLFLTAALFALGAWAWGPQWPLFAASIVIRFFVLSLLDNAPHYGTTLDAGLQARNTRFPGPLGWLILNQNFHDIHHHQPQLSWHDLRARFAEAGASYQGTWAAAVLRQFRGPLRLE